jgi:hypothetical protein
MKNLRKSDLVPASVFAACLALASCSFAADGPAAQPANSGPAPAGLRMFYASHSLMWDDPQPFGELTEAYGIKDQKIDIERKGFSRTQEFWGEPEAQSPAKKALKTGNLDVFVMSPMDMPDTGVDGFVTLGILNNPHMRFFVQNNWAGFNQDGQKARQSMMGPVHPWDATTEEQLKTLNTVCEKAFEDQVQQINTQIGHPVLFIIPTSQANTDLRTRIIRKEFPGLEKQSQLFLDNIGHPTPPLISLNVYLHFATIYGKSPVGLPMPAVLKKANKPQWDDNFNKALQELAWKTVTNYPLSGVKVP